MSEAGKRLLAGAAEALAFAKGEEPAARIHINGHTYVPESALIAAKNEGLELAASIAQMHDHRGDTSAAIRSRIQKEG